MELWLALGVAVVLVVGVRAHALALAVGGVAPRPPSVLPFYPMQGPTFMGYPKAMVAYDDGVSCLTFLLRSSTKPMTDLHGRA